MPARATKDSVRSFARARLARQLMGTLVAVSISSGCSSTAQAPVLDLQADRTPQQAEAPPITPLPFNELVKQIPVMKRRELRAQLQAVVDSKEESEGNKQRAAYVLGRLMEKGGTQEDLESAIELFQKASHVQGLWERCQWHISECAASAGLETEVRGALKAIIERSKDKRTLAAAEYGIAQSYLRGDEPKAARDAFLNLREKYPGTQYALGAGYYLGQSEIESADTRSEALARWREYLKASPDGHFALEIVETLGRLPDVEPTASDHELFGRVRFAHGDWDKALSEWTAAKSDRFWLSKSLCLVRLGRKDEGRKALEEGIAEHANSPEIAEAAEALCRMLNRDQAYAVWKSVLASSPKFGDVALFNLARRSSHDQALALYAKIVFQYPHSQYAPEADWWLIWEEVKQGKSALALAHAEKALKHYPDTKPAARFSFWCGKLNERLGKKEAAIAAYKRTADRFGANYYAHRAAQRLSALSGKKDRAFAVVPARKHPRPDWQWPEPPALVTWDALSADSGEEVLELIKLSQWTECLDVLPDNASSTVRSYLLARLGQPLEAINTAAANSRSAASRSQAAEIAYPLLYAQSVSEEAAEKKVDPLLVHALIREESRYNARALSRSNALGLMQLLPGTAYGVAKRLAVPLSGVEDIYGPATNIKLGTDYLSYGIRRARGDAMIAVAGYNGGPNAAGSWQRQFRARGLTDYDTFVEDIPFRETRDYVRKVFGSYWTYEQLYGSAPQAARTASAPSGAVSNR